MYGNVVLLFFEFCDRYAGIAFSEFCEFITFYIFLAFQVLVNRISQSTGTFTMYDADTFQMGQISVIQILVQLGKRLIYGITQQIDLRRNAKRFGHFDAAGVGTGEDLLFYRLFL